MFTVRWSSDVHEEWITSRLKRFPDTERAALERKRSRMDEVFPNALVTGYAPLIETFNLPDENDRHVAAAATVAGANVIVTDNVKHFPAEALRGGMLAQATDEFIADQIYLTNKSPRLVAIALIRHKNSLRTTRPTWQQYLGNLRARLPITHTLVNDPAFRTVMVEALRNDDWRT